MTTDPFIIEEESFPARKYVEARLVGRVPHANPELYVDIPDGWLSLVAILDLDINHIDEDYVLLQVKEKFGGLRYYTENYELHKDLIMTAEKHSTLTCQTCGDEGELRQGLAWVRTLCNTHYKEAQDA